ncbi:Fer-1-like protein 4 [Apodemus speciosus]|uniref:Fer-1-like protein 4 n=1 Tax=Apodemus speciosus TaxID=105296 RepID=A0ABQ0EFJ3_APOSI
MIHTVLALVVTETSVYLECNLQYLRKHWEEGAGALEEQALPKKQGKFIVAQKQTLLFRWPHYGSPLTGESLPLGTLVISLQQLQGAGHLVLREALVDERLRVSPIQVELDLKYQPPEGAAGTWAEEDFGTPIRDSLELTIPNVGFQDLEPGEAQLERRAVALGRRLARSLGAQDDEDERSWSWRRRRRRRRKRRGDFWGGVQPLKRPRPGLSRGDPFKVCKAQDFQVGVTVLEAQKLVGVNINPMWLFASGISAE